jgi:serine/threonine-protein kinase
MTEPVASNNFVGRVRAGDEQAAGSSSGPPRRCADDPAEQLQLLWQQGQQPIVGEFLAQAGPLTPEQVAAVLRVDQRQRWQAGQRVPVEDYLQAHPAVEADSEAALDLIFSEFLLREQRGERPDVVEYVKRFPRHAPALRDQAELHQALQENAATAAPSLLQDLPTVPPAACRQAAPPTPSVPVPPVPGPGPANDLRTQLQKRLRIVALFELGCAVLAVLVNVGRMILGWTALPPAIQGVIVSLSLLGLVVLAVITPPLWRRSISLRWLRAIEVILFGGPAVAVALVEYLVLREGDWLLFAPLHDHGLQTLGRAHSLPWVFLIALYGIYVPNTARRCALVVGIIGLIPLAVCTLAGFQEPRLTASQVLAYAGPVAISMLLTSLIAIYRSHRIEALRRQAVEARKLGPYQLKKQLGAGGMGEVYLAEHVLLKRPCAIKLIRPERAGNPTELQRFEREVRATSALTHPNTVQVFDYGHADDGTFYYAMEYLPGINLDELVERHGPLPPGRTIHLLRQLCGALAEAHAAGLIHRDIKPGNIILGERGGRHDVVKLLDFGLVRLQTSGPDEMRLTQEGAIAGTPAFMSPEQAGGQQNLDGRSDIYSLGALAYFVLTGQVPFAGRSMIHVLLAHISEPPKPLTDHRPDAPADLQEVVLRCLAKEPAGRFADVESLEQALALCSAASRWTEAEAAAWWRAPLNQQNGAGPAPGPGACREGAVTVSAAARRQRE